MEIQLIHAANWTLTSQNTLDTQRYIRYIEAYVIHASQRADRRCKRYYEYTVHTPSRRTPLALVEGKIKKGAYNGYVFNKEWEV